MKEPQVNSNAFGIRPVKMRAAIGGGIARIWAAVPSRSQAGLEHIVCLNVQTGEARHAEKSCKCPAANHGRNCWHVNAVVQAAREAGYLPTPRRVSVFGTKISPDRVEEI